MLARVLSRPLSVQIMSNSTSRPATPKKAKARRSRTEFVQWILPLWVATTIRQTLDLDARSVGIDRALRRRIARAHEAIEVL